ncbi:MAG TPA: ATP-binding protein [Spirochaetia bacterium]|nr:ATP-binding protein [Spirochaetia bacterium]
MDAPQTAYFLTYPAGERRLIIDRFAELHHARMRYLVPLLLLLAVFFLVSDFLTRATVTPQTFRWYISLDTLFLVVQLAALLYVRRAGPVLPRRKRRVARGIMYAYAQVVLLWAAVLAAVDLRETGDATAIIIAVMAVSTLALFPLASISSLVVSSLVVFVAGVYLLPATPVHPIFQQIIFVFGLLVVSLFVSQSLFSAFVRNVVSEDRLARANAELKTVQMGLIQKEKFATIGQLSAGIAHEINNPLGYLKSNFSTLEQNFRYMTRNGSSLEGDPSYTHFREAMGGMFQDIRDGFRHITEVIDNLRSFSYVPPADYYGRYDLARGIESTLVLAHSAYSGVATIVTRVDGLPEIEARGSEINQVLLNILLNAVNAIASSPIGDRGTITISCHSDGTHVHCDISDTGPGVPEEIRHRIFDPFFTTKPAGEGLGLGLSLSYEIVANRHHGALRLLEGLPTTFRISLPIRQPREASA